MTIANTVATKASSFITDSGRLWSKAQDTARNVNSTLTEDAAENRKNDDALNATNKEVEITYHNNRRQLIGKISY